MERWKEEYDNITVPKQVKEKMEEAVMRARESKKRAKRNRLIRYMGSAAAVFAILLILPNTSRTAAAAMQQIPVLGEFFKVVTIREYQVDEDRYQADVKVPEVVPETGDGVSEETAQQAKETADAINFDIQKVTDELIEEFKSTMEEFEDGYGDIMVDSQVLTDDEKWFSLDLVLYQGAGSGYVTLPTVNVASVQSERNCMAACVSGILRLSSARNFELSSVVKSALMR